MPAPKGPTRTGFRIGSEDEDGDDAAPGAGAARAGRQENQQHLTAAAERISSKQRRDAGLRLPGFTSMASEKHNSSHGGEAAHKEGDANGSDSDGDERYYQPGADPETPNIAESAQQLRRSLSVHGLSELANMPPSQIRKQVGSKLWRPQDEQVRVPSDWERLAVHVVRGGVRSFNLAFTLRGSVMIVFALIRALRTKKAQGKAFLLAVFGAENIRFGLMFAAWTMLYKATSNALRLGSSMPELYRGHSRPRRSKSAPAPREGACQSTNGSGDEQLPVAGNAESFLTSGDESNASGDGHASGTATPRSGYHELAGKEGEERMKAKARQKQRAFMRDPRSRVWHAYLAGAISGLAILVERKDSRISLAQQLLVRGLEGTYNSAHARGLVSIPHGAVITFGMACGQIMYAWLNQPHTLPRGYISWISTASHIAAPVTTEHREIMSKNTASAERFTKWFNAEGKIPMPTHYTAAGKPRYAAIAPNKVNRRGMTGKNVRDLIATIEHLKQGGKMGHVPCSAVHPWENSHVWSPVDRFLEVTRWILPVYMTLHFVPAIFLRMGAFRKDPTRVFLRSLFGSVRSSSFLGVFVIIFQTVFCACHSLADRIQSDAWLKTAVPAWLQKLLISQQMHWGAGFLTCLSLFVEHQRRRTELAMYVLPKGMESAWSVARQRAWLPFVPGGDLLLTSAGMSLVMGTYAQSPEHLSGLVRRIVYQFVGRN